MLSSPAAQVQEAIRQRWQDGGPERIIRVRMSREDFFALPHIEQKTEWRDGWALIMDAARPDHGRILLRIGALLLAALPTCDAIAEPGIATERSNREPDIGVFRRKVQNPPKGSYGYTNDIPLIAIEIISPSTRQEDMIFKAAEYAVKGVEQYWIVDPVFYSLTVFTNAGGYWDEGSRVELDCDNPVGEIQVSEVGIVPIDLRELFA